MAIRRLFTGKLNKDTSAYLLEKGDYTDALNITTDSPDQEDGSVTAIKSNRLAFYGLPAGTNKVIGAKSDIVRGKIYYFIYNSNGYHSIVYFHEPTRVFVNVLQSKTQSDGIDILKFSPNHRVGDVHIIYRDNGSGDILFFNDGLNRPAKINVDDFAAGGYSVVTDELIRVARVPPLLAPTVAYESNPAVKVNNLKKKLFQFKYRWVYKDGEKSVWSPISKVKLPPNASDRDIEKDPSKNNVISVMVFGGGEFHAQSDYQKVEIAARESNGKGYSDFFLVETLGNGDYGILNGGTFFYKFSNDSVYAFLDQNESNLLFDYVPEAANAMALVNGNVLVFGGITDGYNQLTRDKVHVTLTSTMKDVNASTSINPTLTYITRSITVADFVVGPEVASGCVYRIDLYFTGANTYRITASYTATGADTRSTVAEHLKDQINTHYPGATFIAPDTVRFDITIFGNIHDVTVSATAPVFSEGGSPCWKWGSKYRFGIVYFDKYGKTNGVISYLADESDTTDFSVTTPDFALTSTTPRIPLINASINHLPPTWAASFAWVRTVNQTSKSFLQIITNDFQEDVNYYYFCLAGLAKYQDENTGFGPSYEFSPGDRIKVISGFSGTGYFTNQYTDDYEILGVVDRNMSGTTVKGEFVKVNKPATPPISDYIPNMLIELYHPAERLSDSSQVFYEFGENYRIYTNPSDGIKYHSGQTQSQNSTQPALYIFEEGDVYFKRRQFYADVLFTSLKVAGMIDANYSDFFPSAVNSNGRPLIIDAEAKREYYPTLIRFGGEYEQGTNINNTNRFYPDNFDEYDRSFGDIMAFKVRDRQLRVFQKFKVGMAPVFSSIIKDSAGNDTLATSDKLLNPIQYYTGEFGIGTCPESLASNNFADYFVDNIRKVVLRLSNDGITPLSIVYGMNSWATSNLTGRVYGVFEPASNKYILSVEDHSTLAFSETKKGFDSFYSFLPETMVSHGMLLSSFKNGQIYTHDATTYCNFYGVQYAPMIEGVFNDSPDIKKDFKALTQVGSSPWECTISTSLKQQSQLIAGDFKHLEDGWHTAFLRDSLSPKGLLRGDTLKGNWMKIKFTAQNGAIKNELVLAEVSINISNLNNR
jgi:hypothetical protein